MGVRGGILAEGQEADVGARGGYLRRAMKLIGPQLHSIRGPCVIVGVVRRSRELSVHISVRHCQLIPHRALTFSPPSPHPPSHTFPHLKVACDHLSGFNVANRYLIVLYYRPGSMNKKVWADWELLPHVAGMLQECCRNVVGGIPQVRPSPACRWAPKARRLMQSPPHTSPSPPSLTPSLSPSHAFRWAPRTRKRRCGRCSRRTGWTGSSTSARSRARRRADVDYGQHGLGGGLRREGGG